MPVIPLGLCICPDWPMDAETGPPDQTLLFEKPKPGRKNSRIDSIDAAVFSEARGYQTLRASIMRSMMGCRMISMANPILPPGTTMELRRDMKEFSIIDSR